MDIEPRVEKLLKQLTLKEKISLLSGRDAWNTVAIERLGIPSLTVSDGPHGARRETPTTAFPTGSAMAATWNTASIEQVGAALAEETLAANCDVLLGPCVNIVRHPLAGRNFEAYSEDPYLAGRIGVAWVKGCKAKTLVRRSNISRATIKKSNECAAVPRLTSERSAKFIFRSLR